MWSTINELGKSFWHATGKKNNRKDKDLREIISQAVLYFQAIPSLKLAYLFLVYFKEAFHI